jgi:hypothetical protein
MRPPPDFPISPSPWRVGGGLTRVAQDNPLVSVASQYLGVRYTWGGTRPRTGFDCSGLVSYVFAQFGVSLPHYAAAQWYSPDAVWVPPERLQPGDLVFFVGSDGTRRAPGHVGIYVGDGYLIDAPHTGSVVRIDSLDERWFANNYVGAKRIVGIASDARHPVDGRTPGPPAPAIPADFRLPTAIEPPVNGSPGAVLAATAEDRIAPSGYWIRAAAALGVLLLLSAGAIVVRRRRLDTRSSRDPLA